MVPSMSPSFFRLLVLTVFAAMGSDSLLESAQSLPVSTYCVTAGQCAELCRRFVEGGDGPQDFIRRAAFELGPPDTFKFSPATAPPPPVVDPTNVYSGTRAGNFSPAVADALPRIFRPI